MTDLHESFLEQKKKDEENNAVLEYLNEIEKKIDGMTDKDLLETFTKPITEKGRMVFETEKRSPELLWFSGDY